VKPFLAGVAATIIGGVFAIFVLGMFLTWGQGVVPQIIDCRYTGGPPAVQMEIWSNREHGKFVTFRALGCTGYWHVNSRT
jgi:hypothetical protein